MRAPVEGQGSGAAPVLTRAPHCRWRLCHSPARVAAPVVHVDVVVVVAEARRAERVEQLVPLPWAAGGGSDVGRGALPPADGQVVARGGAPGVPVPSCGAMARVDPDWSIRSAQGLEVRTAEPPELAPVCAGHGRAVV